MPDTRSIVSFCLVAALLASRVWAVDIETVPVGNPGNAADTQHGSSSHGDVDYLFNIGKYEVTADQYTEFLNAVATADTYDLYSTSMWSDADGCKIQRSGSSGSYTYAVATDYASRPVNHVSWGDAARFANWLHNGQPTGAQGPGTTETGAYTLNGAVTDAQLLAVSRDTDWRWAIPTDDEWHKAAYHKNDGVTANYWVYPTSSDTQPRYRLVDPDPGNSATHWYETYTIGAPYWRTEVGAHENSASPYGTFDQGGNVWEWTETLIHVTRGTRGGSFADYHGLLRADSRAGGTPLFQHSRFGFRVVSATVDTGTDSDGDGVNDGLDQCPNTISSIEVDTEGCPPFVSGDFDRDGDVDGVDVGAFTACGSGPAASISDGCEIMDFDNDSDVDQEDFGIFQRCLSGENMPGDRDCGPAPGMVLIPAGEFQMGDSFSEGSSNELP